VFEVMCTGRTVVMRGVVRWMSVEGILGEHWWERRTVQILHTDLIITFVSSAV
jgi:hypothetical protein